jgi:hypothetical protein
MSFGVHSTRSMKLTCVRVQAIGSHVIEVQVRHDTQVLDTQY